MKHFVQGVAHRGGSALAPENTLAAFRNARRFPVTDIELDVQMSRDGHLIVFHDNTVERLTDGTGNILDLDFAYLRSLNAAAHFPGGWPDPQQIPTLREVLDAVKGRLQVYIEIKTSKRDGVSGRYPNIAEAVVSAVRAAGMLDQVLIISFDWTILPEIKALEPSLQTGALISRDTWNPGFTQEFDLLPEQVTALGCSWINMDARLFTLEMADAIHWHDLKLGLWTVNALEELRRLNAAGADSLTSDLPNLFAIL